MRIVLIGANSLAITAARLFIEQNHEVVIIEKDEDKVARLSEHYDCSFIVGDGSKPSILQNVGPKNTDFLFSLTDNDRDNIIASLVGRSLGFGRVITVIKDTDYEPICEELGLEGAIFLDRAIARNFIDMVQGVESAGLSGALKGGLRFFSFKIPKDRTGNLCELALPSGTRVVAITRDGKSRIAEDELTLHECDEVLVVAGADQIAELRHMMAYDDRQGDQDS